MANTKAELRGLASFGPKQSLTSLRVAQPELAKIGVDLDFAYLPLRHRRSNWHLLLIKDLQFLYRLHFADLDFVLLNSGAQWITRPRLLKHTVAVAERRGIALLSLWRNAATKFREAEQRIGSAAYARARAAMQAAPVRHMAISQQAADDVQDELGGEKPQVVGNSQSVPARYLEPAAPDDPPIVLNVASVMHRKRPDLFVEIAAKVCAARPDVQFWWVGGDTTPELTAQIDSAGLTDNVKFLGKTNNPYAYMQRCSMFFLTSEEEGFGLVMAEAMACSRTVAAFAETGAAEVPGDSGYVIPMGDVSAAAQCILRVVDRPANERINHEARERYLTHYSPHNYAARLALEIRVQVNSLEEAH